VKLRATLAFLGRLLVVLAAAELLPIVCCLWYGETRAAVAFLVTALITAGAGWAAILGGRKAGVVYRREGILIVVGGWLLASLSGALPYVLTGTAGPIDALFESVSGLTATGASILTSIEGTGYGVLFWRSFSQWLGGMGIIVLFVALLPELGAGARFIYKLEVPGPTAETLHPRVRDTAAAMWRIYALLTLAQVVLLLAAGLNLFDALTHTFSTLSTGGFSPRNASVAAFDSPAVELIVILFMVLAGANFSLYYRLGRLGRESQIWRDPELRIYLAVVAGFTGWITWHLVATGTYAERGISRAALDALFQVSSILTTTGFATANYDQWPVLAKGLMVVLMFIGGSAGSTAGGLKIIRMVVGIKAALREVRLIFSPSAVIAVFVGGKAVPESVVRSVMGIFILYFSLWGLGTLLLTVGLGDTAPYGLHTSATASIVTLGNIGPGLEGVGPAGNFAFFSGWQKLVMVMLMLAGRLEVYAIAALFTLAFWRK